MATYFLGQYETRQYADDNGAPLAGGRVASYLSGTSTPTPTYRDALGTPNANPLVLDSAGRASIYLDTALTYKFLITDAAGVTVETVDPINPLPLVTPGNIFTVAPGSAAFPGFTFTGDENTGLYGPAADILAVTTGGVERMRVGAGVSIGTTAEPGAANLRVAGTLQVDAGTTLNGALNVTGAATFSGGIVGTISAAGLTVTTLGVTGLATIGTLGVTGDLTAHGALSVEGGTSLNTLQVNNGALLSAVGISGNATIAGTLGVTGLTTLSAVAVTGQTTTATLSVSGGTSLNTLNVGGAATLSALGVSGATTLSTLGVTTVSGNPAFTGNVTIGGSLSVSANTALLGNLGIGSSNITDAIAVPTIASGFGTGATIGGRAYAFKIVVGSGLPTGGTINFNTTYAVPPAVVVTSNQLSSGYVVATSSTTQVTLQSTNALQPATGLYVLVRGV